VELARNGISRRTSGAPKCNLGARGKDACSLFPRKESAVIINKAHADLLSHFFHINEDGRELKDGVQHICTSNCLFKPPDQRNDFKREIYDLDNVVDHLNIIFRIVDKLGIGESFSILEDEKPFLDSDNADVFDLRSRGHLCANLIWKVQNEKQVVNSLNSSSPFPLICLGMDYPFVFGPSYYVVSASNNLAIEITHHLSIHFFFYNKQWEALIDDLLRNKLRKVCDKPIIYCNPRIENWWE
jgi:hypothetical protein